MPKPAPQTRPPPPLVRFVEVEDVRLRVATQRGRDDSVPLLIFNGIGANLELLFPLMAAMAGTEIVVFDIPGIGGSDISWRPRYFSDFADLSATLLDRLDYTGEVHVAGISWGGALAQQFAYQFPLRCRQLVLAATSPGTVMVPGYPPVLPAMIAEYSAQLIAPSIAGFCYQLGAGFGWTSLPWLHRLRQPTLILAGEDDPLVPVANAWILEQLIPQSRLHIVPGGGHLFMLDSPGSIAPLLRGFLASAESIPRRR